MAQRWLILRAGGHSRSACNATDTLVNRAPVLGSLSLAWDFHRLGPSVEAPNR